MPKFDVTLNAAVFDTDADDAIEGVLPSPSLTQAACIEANRLGIHTKLFAELLGISRQAVTDRKKDRLVREWYYLDLPAPEPTQEVRDRELYKWWLSVSPATAHCYACGLWFEPKYQRQSRCKACNSDQTGSFHEKKYRGQKSRSCYRPRGQGVGGVSS